MRHTRRRSGKLFGRAVIGIAVIVMGVGGGIALVARTRAQADPAGATAKAQELGKGQPNAAHKGAEAPAPEVVDLGEFLVNVHSSTGLRYLRVQAAVELTPPITKDKKKAKVAAGKPEAPQLPPEDLLRARDAVVTQLNASDFSTLRTLRGQAELKNRLGVAVSSALTGYGVGKVFFPAFAMQ